MPRTIEASGRSIDEAIFKGLKELEISIDEVEIDILLRSKAAMYTILRTVTLEVGLEFEDLAAFSVAGAFGNVIDPDTAITLGMLPDLLWAGADAPVTLTDLPGSPVREIFAASRHASSSRPGIRLVRDALDAAFAAAAPAPR